MKQFYLRILAIVLAFGCGLGAWAYDKKDGYGVCYNLVDGGVEIVGYEGTVTAIPDYGWADFQIQGDEYEHYQIVSIKAGAFKNCTTLESVTLTYSSLKIGDGAFEGCTNLKKVTLDMDRPINITQVDPFKGLDRSNIELWTYSPGNSTFATFGWTGFGLERTIGSIKVKVVINDESVTVSGLQLGRELGNGYYEAYSGSWQLVFYPNKGKALESVKINGVNVTNQVVGNIFYWDNIQNGDILEVTFGKDPNCVDINVSRTSFYSVVLNGEGAPEGQLQYTYPISKGEDLGITIYGFWGAWGEALLSVYVDDVDITAQIVHDDMDWNFGKYTISNVQKEYSIRVEERPSQKISVTTNGYYVQVGYGESMALASGYENFEAYTFKGENTTIVVQSFFDASGLAQAQLFVDGVDVTAQVVNGIEQWNSGLYTIANVQIDYSIVVQRTPKIDFNLNCAWASGNYQLNGQYANAWGSSYSYEINASVIFTIENPDKWDQLQGLVPQVICEYNGVSEDVSSRLVFDSATGNYSLDIQQLWADKAYNGVVNININYVEDPTIAKVNVTKASNTTVTLDGTPDFLQTTVGSNVTVTVTPAAGYNFYKLLVDGQDVTDQVSNGTYVINNLQHKTYTVEAYSVQASLSFSERYMTFCSDASVEFPEGGNVKAWVATGYRNDGYVTLTPVTVVPAGVGVLLEATEGTSVDLTQFYTNKTMAYGNLLRGVTVDTWIGETDYHYYGDQQVLGYNLILAQGDKGIGFYGTYGGTIAAGKAYLWVPATAMAMGVKSFGLSFEDEATGIAERRIQQNQGKWFTLDGRQVERPAKGVLVRNGKKVIIK